MGFVVLCLASFLPSSGAVEKIFRDASFHFEHPENMLPTQKKTPGGHIKMTLLSTIGASVVIEEFSRINPQALIDPLVHELTKEEASYGYKITVSPSSTTLTDGTVLKGKKVVSSYKDREWTRFVYAYPAKDSGLLIYTQIEKTSQDSQPLIDRFWSSLKIGENLKSIYQADSSPSSTKEKEFDPILSELRKENEELRTQLKKERDTKNTEEIYWISLTGKRHNKNCRFFKNCDGVVGKKDDGIPCKLCGG